MKNNGRNQDTMQNITEAGSVKDYAIILIVKVLKKINYPENALSTGQIAALIAGTSETAAADLSQKTISNKLNHLLRMQEDRLLGPILFRTLGGKVLVTSARGILQGRYIPSYNAQRTQKYYYFEPLLSDAQLFMLGTMIKSHPYVSAGEKEAILVGLDLNVPVDAPKQTYRYSEIPLPGEAGNLMYHIDMLYEAIRRNQQVTFKYGAYDENPKMQGKTSKVIFRLRKNEQGEEICYRVNPYALVWDKGYYYLVATKAGTADIRHYRIDRIVEPHLAYQIIDGKEEKVCRDFNPYNKEDIQALKELGTYFKDGIFDAARYVRNHYGMKIFKTEELVTFSVKCTYLSLQMLVDAFGNDITLEEVDQEVFKSDLGTYRADEKQLQATIRNVEYQTALSFCLAHMDYITVIGPENLKKEVKEWLKNAIRAIDGTEENS